MYIWEWEVLRVIYDCIDCSVIQCFADWIEGFQRVRMYDLASTNPNPILNYDGIQKNVTAIGFQQDGKWMFTGSEDNAARIWDLRWEKPVFEFEGSCSYKSIYNWILRKSLWLY